VLSKWLSSLFNVPYALCNIKCYIRMECGLHAGIVWPDLQSIRVHGISCDIPWTRIGRLCVTWILCKQTENFRLNVNDSDTSNIANITRSTTIAVRLESLHDFLRRFHDLYLIMKSSRLKRTLEWICVLKPMPKSLSWTLSYISTLKMVLIYKNPPPPFRPRNTLQNGISHMQINRFGGAGVPKSL